MKSLWNWLAGKKTYICTAAAAICGVLADSANPKLALIGKIGVAIFGGGAVASLRAAVGASNGKPPTAGTDGGGIGA
jgi:hypothetical protein